MKINKQLFEDVLLGKLKGTFVLRNEEEISSNELIPNKDSYSETHPFKLHGATYTSNGLTSLFDWESYYDIIDFIPDTDMKENELTIEIPKEKTVDWDESKKQNKIVFKDKQLTYENICERLFENEYFFTNAGGSINHSISGTSYYCANNASSKHQLECILAKNKLANTAIYLNDGWNPSKYDTGHVLNIIAGVLMPVQVGLGYHDGAVVFKTSELARQAIAILGKETIKLALEPLGI